LSLGGALLESTLPLQPESVHRFRFALDGQVTDIQARVRHVTPWLSPTGEDRYLIGLEFLAVPSTTRDQIERLVAANLDLTDKAAET
jgi:hypothetical protein